NVDSVPSRSRQHLGVRGATKVVGQIGTADVPRQHHAADAEGDQRASAPSRASGSPRWSSKTLTSCSTTSWYAALTAFPPRWTSEVIPISGQQPSRSSKCSREK